MENHNTFQNYSQGSQCNCYIDEERKTWDEDKVCEIIFSMDVNRIFQVLISCMELMKKLRKHINRPYEVRVLPEAVTETI